MKESILEPKIILSILTTIFLVSCSSAKWIEKDKSSQSGTIAYSKQGDDNAIKKNRAAALKEIKGFCSGNYKITSEVDKFESTTRYPVDNSYSAKQRAAALSMNQPSKNAHISFQCN